MCTRKGRGTSPFTILFCLNLTGGPKVVAMGTGSKCIGRSKMDKEGTKESKTSGRTRRYSYCFAKREVRQTLSSQFVCTIVPTTLMKMAGAIYAI